MMAVIPVNAPANPLTGHITYNTTNTYGAYFTLSERRVDNVSMRMVNDQGDAIPLNTFMATMNFTYVDPPTPPQMPHFDNVKIGMDRTGVSYKRRGDFTTMIGGDA
eukprot:jgi/Tetstr1/435445/TSEL_024351.t1